MMIFLFMVLQVIACVAFKAQIESCKGWRLNKLPEVRKFLLEPGHADTYEDLHIKWTGGHSPELTIYDENGSIVEQIDLSPYSVEQLHDLMAQKGVTRKVYSEEL